MASALQWHIASNTAQPVALATTRSAEGGFATNGLANGSANDVTIVMCDCAHERAENARAAAALAQDILNIYSAHSGRLDDIPSSASDGADVIDVVTRLAYAISSGLERLTHHDLVPESDGGMSRTARAHSAPQAAFAVVAVVIRKNQLFVAQYGGGRVYLLRNSALQNLTDESFSSSVGTQKLEPDLGQLELSGEDRILLCTDAFCRRLNDNWIKSSLRSSPSSRQVAQMLIDAATRNTTDANEIVALAVVDYVTGGIGTFPIELPDRSVAVPTRGIRRPISRSIAAVTGLTFLLTTVGLASVLLARGSDGRMGLRTADSIPALTDVSLVMAPVTDTGVVVASMEIQETPPATTAPSVELSATHTSPPPSAPTALPTLPATLTPLPATPIAGSPTSLEIFPSGAMIGADDSVVVTATVRDAAGYVVTAGTVTWNPTGAITSIGQRTGDFSIGTVGVYVITATLGSVSGSAIIVVDPDWRGGAVDLSLPTIVPASAPTAGPTQ